MFDTEGYFLEEKLEALPPIVEPNRITGEGRTKCRPLSRHKSGDLKKKKHRKMAKKSRRQNRR